MARVKSWYHWSPTSQDFWRGSSSPKTPCRAPAFRVMGTGIQFAETVLRPSCQSSYCFLTASALSANTACSYGTRNSLYCSSIIFLPSATDLLAPSAQVAFVEKTSYFASELIMMLWECHCSVSQKVQGVGYLDGFERNALPMRGNIFFLFFPRKRKNNTQANAEPMIYGNQHCLECKYRQAPCFLLMVLCTLG